MSLAEAGIGNLLWYFVCYHLPLGAFPLNLLQKKVLCLRPRGQFLSFSFHPSAKLRKKHEDATPSMLGLVPVVPTLEGLAQQSLEPELPGNPLNPSVHSSQSRYGLVGFLSKNSRGISWVLVVPLAFLVAKATS